MCFPVSNVITHSTHTHTHTLETTRRTDNDVFAVRFQASRLVAASPMEAASSFASDAVTAVASADASDSDDPSARIGSSLVAAAAVAVGHVFLDLRKNSVDETREKK